MSVRLLIHDRESTLAGRLRQEDLPDSPCILGRSRGADLFLNDPALSPRHLRLGPSGAWVEDLNSRGGTRLNAKRLLPGKPVPLRPGDELQAGPFVMQLLDGQGSQADSSRPGERADGVSGWELRQLAGPGPERRLRIRPGQQRRMGRGTDSDLVLPHKRISRDHLRLCCRSGGRLSLHDLGSKNGFRLNGRSRRRVRRLRAGDCVALGPFVFQVARQESAVGRSSWTGLLRRLERPPIPPDAAWLPWSLWVLSAVLLAAAAFLL